MTPAYLQHQLAASLRNLRLHCVDIYYVHNPETQLGEIEPEVFHTRMRAAFAQLEDAVAAGQIRSYGVATWNGLRQPEDARDHLSLQTLLQLARDVAGGSHHFRVVQAPFNLAMPEAFARRNQRVGREVMSLLAAAQRLGITVVGSAAILQGQLSRRLPAPVSAALPGLETEAQRAIQFARSAPGITSALVGMKQTRHVDENLATARVAGVGATGFAALFRESGAH